MSSSQKRYSRWLRRFCDEKAEAFPGRGSQTSQAALIARLRREDLRLRKEWASITKDCAPARYVSRCSRTVRCSCPGSPIATRSTTRADASR